MNYPKAILLIGALIAPLLACAPAFAQTAPKPAVPLGALDPDVKCLVSTMTLSSSDDEHVKSVANMGASYYLGRLDARAISTADLEDRMVIVLSQMTPDQLRTELDACAKTLEDTAGNLKTVGEEVSRRTEH